MKTKLPSTLAALAALALGPALFAADPAASFPVKIEVDAGQSLGALKPIWRFFGADEPNYATMKDGRRLLGELGELRPDDIFFRTHHLLVTGDGTPALKWGSTNIYTEDAQGRPVYSWTIVDRIFDTYRARGVHPYVELGFMPQALATQPNPYQHEWRPGLAYGRITMGWACPPTDYHKWAELVFQWTKHCVERYGQAEVEKWYWEVWNEANLGAYWRGTPEEFYQLHDFAIDAVRRALPTARVGGPDVAGTGGEFMDKFLAHVARGKNYATGATGTPTDFLSFHAKGQPTFVDGHMRMGIAAQLKGIDDGCAKIAAVPELKAKPIVIGESDPEGCAACQGPNFSYRNGTVYSSYTAASFARESDIAARHGVNLEGALTWAFEFEDQPYFAGFRQLASNGIPLAVLNVFRMFSRMGGQRLAVTSTGAVALDDIIAHGVRGAPDVSALAALDGHRLTVLAWHYHDDDIAGPDADVTLDLAHLPGHPANLRVEQYQIDADHSNAFGAWKKMGSPLAPNDAQYAALQQAAELARIGSSSIAGTPATLSFKLPRQAVTLLVFEWAE